MISDLFKKPDDLVGAEPAPTAPPEQLLPALQPAPPLLEGVKVGTSELPVDVRLKLKVEKGKVAKTQRDRQSDLASVDIIQEDLLNSQAESQRLTARMEQLKIALAQAPPPVQSTEMNTGEVLATILGGFITGDHAGMANQGWKTATERTGVDNHNRQAEFEAKRQALMLEYQDVASQADEARGSVRALGNAKINAVAQNERDQKQEAWQQEQAEESKRRWQAELETTTDANAQRDIQAAINSFYNANNPGEVEYAAKRLNEYAKSKNRPDLSVAESQVQGALMAAVRKEWESMVAPMERAYLGTIPDTPEGQRIMAELEARKTELEARYGIKLRPINSAKHAEITQKEIQRKHDRETVDARLAADRYEFNKRFQFDQEKFNKDYGLDWAKFEEDKRQFIYKQVIDNKPDDALKDKRALIKKVDDALEKAKVKVKEAKLNLQKVTRYKDKEKYRAELREAESAEAALREQKQGLTGSSGKAETVSKGGTQTVNLSTGETVQVTRG